ncbi:single-stranded DNA-binding protein 3-like isoform X2 [Physella acuta]|uniref:single-stranded DNA-binding protein 3-like isoform X2 n=1 Tax=Physella acuta TaxID=109671 RepID=UPI0027DAC559|nr:single-stranded DNA-binding protein 3-like isoform X2 [Physella acuta]
MYAKGKGSTVPSDAQAREKLALYVYEYLLHVGAQKSAQTFLSEIRWEKNITLGEPPGFLHSWWCVFWDLYCAAPERRETCDHSSEAKAFHDYGFVNSGYSVNGMAPNAAAPSPLGQMPPQDGMAGGPIPPSFFPPFMSPRYPGGPRVPVRMPNQVDFNTGPPGPGGGQMPMPNSMDPRPDELHHGFLGHPGMGPMQRMSHPGGRMPGPMNPMYDSLQSYGVRGPPPNSSMGPGPGPGGMPPLSMPGGPGPQNRWPLSSSSMNCASPASYNMNCASPANYNDYVPQGPPPSGGPPGTPIMPSPQGEMRRTPTSYSPVIHGGGGDPMYMMKQGPPGMGMPGFPMGGPDGPMGPMGPGDMPSVMNGNLMSDMDGMKNSPANGRGTPRDDMPPVSSVGGDMGPYGLGGYQDSEHNESAAILKIKESMQEEAKQFEKEEPNEFFMQS